MIYLVWCFFGFTRNYEIFRRIINSAWFSSKSPTVFKLDKFLMSDNFQKINRCQMSDKVQKFDNFSHTKKRPYRPGISSFALNLRSQWWSPGAVCLWRGGGYNAARGLISRDIARTFGTLISSQALFKVKNLHWCS